MVDNSTLFRSESVRKGRKFFSFFLVFFCFGFFCYHISQECHFAVGTGLPFLHWGIICDT